jgi:hypothetical protein
MENRRVVLINGDTSSWFDHAIIIVKEGHKNGDFVSGKPTRNLLMQAERIINASSPFGAYTKNCPSATISTDSYGSSQPPKHGGTCPSTAREPQASISKKVPVNNKGGKGKKDNFDTFLNVVVLIGCLMLAGVLILSL